VVDEPRVRTDKPNAGTAMGRGAVRPNPHLSRKTKASRRTTGQSPGSNIFEHPDFHFEEDGVDSEGRPFYRKIDPLGQAAARKAQDKLDQAHWVEGNTAALLQARATQEELNLAKANAAAGSDGPASA